MSDNTIGGGNKALNTILKYFFEHKIIIKMYHFQTSSFGAHKATDAYLLKFDANFDRFMEVAQGVPTIGGKDRKIKMDGVNMDINFIKDDPNDTTYDMIRYLDTFANSINSAISSDDPAYRGLSAIRDEIIADAQQLAYLLKFK